MLRTALGETLTPEREAQFKGRLFPNTCKFLTRGVRAFRSRPGAR